uniref:Uncharacterized protein n=1 Tax=Rhizophora mucronata TaxID=61149 RepID=A0A2P2N058_RHIMU
MSAFSNPKFVCTRVLSLSKIAPQLNKLLVFC